MQRIKGGAFKIDLAILILGIGWLATVMLMPSPPKATYFGAVHRYVGVLRTGGYSDLTQDVIGFRAIWKNEDAYPILGPAMLKLGIPWDVKHASTHPPTAFLLLSPVAWMPINMGAITWAWMMVGCFAVSFFCLGCSAMRAVGFSFLIMAWPPAASCLGQLTAIWLMGVCISYRAFVTMPALSGVGLAIASATKLAPAIMLLLFVRSKNALIGFAVIWLVLISCLLLLSPQSIKRYLEVSKYEVPQQFGRPDNSSIIARASRSFGKKGRLMAVAFLAVVIAANMPHIIRGNLNGWAVLAYIAVAALPILWIYSIVPLLFLGRWALSCGLAEKICFYGFVLATTTNYVRNSPIGLTWAIVGLGIGMIATGLMRWNTEKQQILSSFPHR